MHHRPMTLEGDVSRWKVVCQGYVVELCWHKLPSVIWADDVATFPVAPDEPGVYLVKVTLGDRYRLYVGEAASLRTRLRSYGGRGVEVPNERGRTTHNMKGRVRRTFRAGGDVTAYWLELPITVPEALYELDPRDKDDRIMLERIALTVAYLHGVPLINEHGFPPLAPDHDDPLR